MPEYKAGRLAYSRAGHDRDTLYVVVGEEGDFLYLSDGRLKPLSRPKKKKKKHLQIAKETCLTERFGNGEAVSDEDIRRVLKAEKKRLSGGNPDDIIYQED